MDLRFSYTRNGLTCVGTGLAYSLTSVQVQIEGDQELPSSGDIQLRIDWPFRLQNVCPLELVIDGNIETNASQQAVVRIRSYEFKTCGDQSFEPAMARGAACDLTA
jgi:hypothetical protein